MELTVAEQLTLKLRRAGIEQRQMAAALGLTAPTLSRYLSGIIALPDGFPARFQIALESEISKQAERDRAAAEERAKRLLESVGGEVLAA